MHKAGEVATELRRIADALDAKPELTLEPYLSISVTGDDKDTFVELAKIMPRPMAKGIDFEGSTYEDFKLQHSFWRIKIPRSNVCIVKEPARPAVFECPSILSEAEEATLTSA